MIEVNNLVKIYNAGKQNEYEALHGISFHVAPGEMVAIVGKSGAGKSTLLHILAGIETLEGGSCQVNGMELGGIRESRKSQYRNKTVGLVMQDYGLIDDYSVSENVFVPLLFDKSGRSKKHLKVKKALEDVQMSEYEKKPVKNLSGGQKQRVAIARAIVNEPMVLLADEPTGALDTATGEEIMKVFRRLNEEGKTIILVTHDQQIAEHCDRKIVIEDGKIVEE